jgi:hypothetical protein
MYISIERNQLNITTAGAIRPRPYPKVGLSVLLDMIDGNPRLRFEGVDSDGFAQLAQALDEARRQLEVAARTPGERSVIIDLGRVVADSAR